MECTLGEPHNHSGLHGSDKDMTKIITACRGAVGFDFKMMIDVQYLWYYAKRCLRTICKWEDLDIYFLETPLRIDNFKGYAFLAKESPIRIAAGESQNTRFELLI